jgi:hypothetical protein
MLLRKHNCGVENLYMWSYSTCRESLRVEIPYTVVKSYMWYNPTLAEI